MKKIGIMTGGADCPGLNSVIRAVVRKGMQEGYVITGIKNGWMGLIENDMRVLDVKSTTGILDKGGTILGTSRVDPLNDEEHVKKIKENYARSGMDALIVVGGEETIKIALYLHKKGIIQAVAVPKSIDKALSGTDYAFGFDTAVNIATECIDRLHTTAESHHRIMILEVMGRTAGWIALYAGVAGGGDVILLPEIPYDITQIAKHIKERRKKGKKFTILVVSEGAKPIGGKVTVQRMVKDGSEPIRLGGVSFVVGQELEKLTGIETRNVVLGHLQRGGSPSPFDRILGTQLGAKAVDFIAQGHFGCMVGVKDNHLVKVPLSKVAMGSRLVPVDHSLVKDARDLGVCFGD